MISNCDMKEDRLLIFWPLIYSHSLLYLKQKEALMLRTNMVMTIIQVSSILTPPS